MKKSNNKKGFTLVELVIVVAVIAILSAILIPTIGTVIKDAKDVSMKADLRTLITNKMTEANSSGDIIGEEIPEQYFLYVEDGKVTHVFRWTGSEVVEEEIATINWVPKALEKTNDKAEIITVTPNQDLDVPTTNITFAAKSGVANATEKTFKWDKFGGTESKYYQLVEVKADGNGGI